MSQKEIALTDFLKYMFKTLPIYSLQMGTLIVSGMKSNSNWPREKGDFINVGNWKS